ncbi:hypothetical protein [Nostoc sp.]
MTKRKVEPVAQSGFPDLGELALSAGFWRCLRQRQGRTELCKR